NQRDFVEQINRGGRHLLDVLRDILEVSRIEAGHVEIIRSPCDLDIIANDLLGLFRLQANSRLLSYSVVIDDDVPRHIIVDAAKLRQIAINL
ncbi:MAG: hypothetical protein GW890_05915, partial [Vibrio sp.]|nr:hypothetical protein [Vibrio sp.]